MQEVKKTEEIFIANLKARMAAHKLSNGYLCIAVAMTHVMREILIGFIGLILMGCGQIEPVKVQAVQAPVSVDCHYHNGVTWLKKTITQANCTDMQKALNEACKGPVSYFDKIEECPYLYN